MTTSGHNLQTRVLTNCYYALGLVRPINMSNASVTVKLGGETGCLLAEECEIR